LIEGAVREHWWAVVASVAGLTGDLATAEDAAQEACLAALVQWSTAGEPPNPRAWLIATARHKARDRMRREAVRHGKEVAAMREIGTPGASQGHHLAHDTTPVLSPDLSPEVAQDIVQATAQDQLGLIFMCCHPALDQDTRVALTLRVVCGLTSSQIAAVFLVTEPAMTKRLVRARRKMRDSRLGLRLPAPQALAERLASVLRVVYLVFTEGHRASGGPGLVRDELCDTAIALARELHALLPAEPEVTGLLALLLLTDARRAARTDRNGEIVLLEKQDRTRYTAGLIREGEALLDRALRLGRPGPYQIQAAIAACHSNAATAQETDWREISALYGELLRHDPQPVHEANRAIAVAMAEGPAAGLVVLDTVVHHPQLARWPTLHVARADLLTRLGRRADALVAYRSALELDPGSAERAFIHRQIGRLQP
jgi:RNA polymerase sigma-70 factor, ECF subfamily